MIKYTDINISFADRHIYKNFNINFNEKDINFIMGESGIGKTTLIKYIIQDFINKDIKVSVVFQESRLLPWKNVFENLELVIKNNHNYDKKEILIKEILEKLNLTNCEKLFPHELSGGMRQRVSIARALLYDGEIFIMDEPFKGLDKENKDNVIKLIYSYLQEKEKTSIIISHDINEIKCIKNKYILLKGEPVIATICKTQ